MKKYLILMMLGAVALMGCNGRGESSITSSYGASTISGEVFLTGMPNSSPAGVEVSVRGTGMTAMLGADGQFTFANVPEGALLDFRRAADGIEASLHIDGSGFVTVELQQNKAAATAKKSRRRSGAKGGEKVHEFEGLIRSAAADSIVVYTSKKQEVTIGLTADTIIRKGQTLLTPADLLVDTRVHVKARFANDAYTAILVIVQNEDDGEEDDTPPAVREYQGTVVSMTAQELVVFTSHKEEVTFLLTGDTVIRKGSATFDLAQILIGMIVHVKATPNADGTNTATLVIVQNTRVPAELGGTVALIGTSSLVVTTATGDVTVVVSTSSQIRKSGKKIALADVVVGDTVEVQGTQVDATTVAAKKITIGS